MTRILPYGSWPSPLDARLVAGASPRIDGARFVGDEIWWGQTVPEEGGRVTVRRRGADGRVDDLLAAPLSARSRVHEYGGGAWTATDAGELVFVDGADQRVRVRRPDGALADLTAAEDGVAYGGLHARAGLLLAVRERPHRSGSVREIVAVPLDGGAATDPELVRVVVGGSDFVAQPSLSADGGELAWIAWDHPDMPWDRTQLRRGRVEDGKVTAWSVVAGGRSAPLQPEWRGDDLFFVDDPTGRWNLWRARAGSAPEPYAAADADTGGALWVLGSRWYGLVDGGVVAVRTDGGDRIVLAAPDGVRDLDTPVVAGGLVEHTRGSQALVSGSTADGGAGLWHLDAATGEVTRIAGGDGAIGAEWMPRARSLSAAGPHGPVHAFAYPPTHPDVEGPGDERAPYLVWVHGGPTAHVGPAASAKTAYFTSRGIGVLDVNYGGSTGYGREYRERLRGQWGVVDVDDVAAAASALVTRGDADAARLVIEGGSAGGWTVLAALTRTDVFAAGVARYAVGDARALAADTHEFESRYLDGLIGPLPEAEAVYGERSPLTHPDRFRVPLLILQGAEDRVVPPAQAKAIRAALAEHGVPHLAVVYDGEGHGFRRAETIMHALETELAFLGAVLGFETPGVPPITLE